jgi:hypothetical protein
VKSSKHVGMILAGLTLSLVGCEPPKPPGEPEVKAEHATKGEDHAGPTRISTPVPPVEPSPLPEMPSTAKGDTAKKEEALPAEKKAQEPAKTEAPK